MSYIPTEWKSGDVVTSEKLNKLENGVINAGGSILIINVNESSVADTKCIDIYEAIISGKNVYANDGNASYQISAFSHNNQYYSFSFGSASWSPLVENGDDDYPRDQG